MSNYWDQREEDWLYNSTLGMGEKELAKEYRRVYRETQDKLLSLYNELVNEKGEILVSDLFRFNRYYDLLNELQQSLYKLGYKEEMIYRELFTEYYRRNCEIIGNRFQWGLPINDNDITKAIDGVWCADGKNWSDRIWSNKTQLQERIRQGIVDSFTVGASKDQLVMRLMEDLNVGYRQADRIARTELAYIRNKSALDTYERMGESEYEVLANQADDDSCSPYDGKTFLISQAQVGVNFPPFHPNCKCCIIPVKRGG